MPTLAEERVKQLAKLKTNTVCPNCGYEKKFGFGTVCIKYLTFVCNECKSSHQAISHRCKSLTMSSWTNDEVEALERGGNLVARRTWLKHAPPEGTGGRPSHGMDINVYKRFIVQVYEERRYYGELDPNDGMAGAAPAAAAGRSSAVAPPPRSNMPIVSPRRPAPQGTVAQARAQVQQPVVPAPAPVAPPPMVADLLDFSAPGPSPATNNMTTTAGDMNLFGADFTSAFQATPAPAPAAAVFDPFGATHVQAPSHPTNNNNNNNNLVDPFAFGNFNNNPTAIPAVAPAAPPPPPPSSSKSLSSSDPFSFGAFETVPTPASSLMSNSTAASSDPFGGAKKPVMGGPSATGNASAISLMGGGRPTGMMMPPPMGGGANPTMMNATSTGMYNNPGMMGMAGTGMNMNMNMMNPQMMAMMQQQMMNMNMNQQGNNFMMNNGYPMNPMGGNPSSNGMGMNMNMNMNPNMMYDQQRKYQQTMNQNKF